MASETDRWWCFRLSLRGRRLCDRDHAQVVIVGATCFSVPAIGTFNVDAPSRTSSDAASSTAIVRTGISASITAATLMRSTLSCRTSSRVLGWTASGTMPRSSIGVLADEPWRVVRRRAIRSAAFFVSAWNGDAEAAKTWRNSSWVQTFARPAPVLLAVPRMVPGVVAEARCDHVGGRIAARVDDQQDRALIVLAQ